MKSIIADIKEIGKKIFSKQGPKLPANIKKKMNNELHKKVGKQTYFKDIPLDPIFDIVKSYGAVPLMEDDTEWEGFLLGGIKKTERVVFELGDEKTKDVKGIYEPFSNAMLVMTYYKMPSGNWEIITYVG